MCQVSEVLELSHYVIIGKFFFSENFEIGFRKVSLFVN